MGGKEVGQRKDIHPMEQGGRHDSEHVLGGGAGLAQVFQVRDQQAGAQRNSDLRLHGVPACAHKRRKF